MPILLLSPRYTPDSIALRRAARAEGWDVERLASWRCPEDLTDRAEVVAYGEPLFAAVVAQAPGLALPGP